MLNVSIVLYNTPEQEVNHVVQTLRESTCIDTIFLIDNSEHPTESYKKLPAQYLYLGKNIGYGAAHNIAIRESMLKEKRYHLVMNSDIAFEPTIFNELLDFMDSHVNVAQLMPKIYYPDGKIQYLCKQLPTPLDLFGRRFLPKSLVANRNAKFELHQFDYQHTLNVPYLSGCFMLLRVAALEQVGLFDERFFMYPEDIDLTRRIHKYYETLFYPYISVIHNHNQSSYKSKRLLWIHMSNMIRYFNKWGWFYDKERTNFNNQLIKDISSLQI